MDILIRQKRTDFVLEIKNIRDLKIDKIYLTYSHRRNGAATFDRFCLTDLKSFKVIV